MGFFNGTQFNKDDSVIKCESIIQEGYVVNAQDVVNMTHVMLAEPDRSVNIYNMFD